MKRFLIVVLLFGQHLFAQKTSDADSIKALERSVDSLGQKDSTKAYRYARIGLALAEKDKNDAETYVFLRKLGNISKRNGNYPLALDYFNQELSLAQQKKDASHIIAAYKDIGVALQDESKYPAAQDNFFKALSISEKEKDHPFLSLLYADIGSTYTIENQIAKAKEYAQKALNVKNNKDTIALTKALELMGVIYKQSYEEKKLGAKKIRDTSLMDSARYYYMQALHIYEAAQNPVGQASMYFQMGTTYEDTYSDDQKGLYYCRRSKEIWDKIDPTNKYALYDMTNIAYDYLAMVVTLDTMPYIRNRHALQDSLAGQGEKYFKEALELSRKSADHVTSLYALDNLSQLQAHQRDYEGAYANIRQYIQIHDSTFSQENADKIVALEAQYEVDIRDRQIEINKLELANRKRIALFLGTGLLFLLAVAGYIYIQNRSRKRKNAQLASLNEQLAHANKINTQFFSILHHDIRRPIAGVISLLNLQKKDPALLDGKNKELYFNRITRSAENLLTTMEDLLLWSKGQMENFKPQFTDIYVKDLFDFIQKTFEGNEVKITFEPEADPMRLHTDEHFLKTILLNLTTNAVHALAHTTGPQIVWKAWHNEDYTYLSIADNGPGATNEQLRPLYDDTISAGIKNGLGLHIVRDMAKAIESKIEINTRVERGVEIVVGIKSVSSI